MTAAGTDVGRPVMIEIEEQKKYVILNENQMQNVFYCQCVMFLLFLSKFKIKIGGFLTLSMIIELGHTQLAIL